MRGLAVLAVAACSSPAHVATPPPVAALPPASTTCYAGIASGMGQRARTIAKRTLDPAAHQIHEELSRDDHGIRSFHVEIDVDGDRFTMKETGGAFTGSGTLTGEAWKWTAWTSTSEIPKAGITVDSDDELTKTGMKATKQIRKDGKVLATTTEELQTFDCAQWDKALADLSRPALDQASCEHSCRNYATLKFQGPPEELKLKLEGGLPTCIKNCLAADNPTQTECLAAAKTVEALEPCLGD